MSAEARITWLQSTFMDEEKMAFLKPSDFAFHTPREHTQAEKANSMSAMIIWQDGKCTFTRMSWKVPGFPFRDQLDACWGTMFGPLHVKIGHVPNYHSSGKGMWTFEFMPSSILAWRCALMTEEDFEEAVNVLKPFERKE